jgi:pyruvate kinase
LKIIKAVKKQNKKIFLATQFFHYMVDHPIPLIAEIDGFYNALELKVDGIQLSEETAIGKYPEEILSTIRGMEKDFDK